MIVGPMDQKRMGPTSKPRLARVWHIVGPWGRRIHPIYIHVIMYMCVCAFTCMCGFIILFAPMPQRVKSIVKTKVYDGALGF